MKLSVVFAWLRSISTGCLPTIWCMYPKTGLRPCGAAAVIVADGRTDLFNPNAIRASLGTIFTVPVAEAPSEAALQWLLDRHFYVFAARVDGSVVYTAADYTGPSAVVLGSEAEGLTDAWSGAAVQAVRLPMLGAADSLNVSVTAAVILYEAVRQRSG